MKNKAKLTCSYLYADGHAVLLYEQEVIVAGQRTKIEYAEIHEKWTNASLRFTGRLYFSRYGGGALLDLARKAASIRASAPSTENGSDNTRKLGLAIGNLTFDFSNGDFLYWTTMPDVISGNHTYQPDKNDKFEPGLSSWGMCQTVIYKLQPKPVEAIAA